jgi:hypothetical protein
MKVLFIWFGALRMKVNNSFMTLMKQRGYSHKAINKLWTWYDYSEKKGVASF